MKLSKQVKWLKEHLEAQMTYVEESLWGEWEAGNLDRYDVGSAEGGFMVGWELGRIEMLTEVLEFIDTLENPVYGDV